ncbi:MAG: class I SAM-dependent methyltransferase [Methyloligellaceae bacterium]
MSLKAVLSNDAAAAPQASVSKAAVTYNAAADHFEERAVSFWSRYGQRTVDRLALTQGSHVLDVGCGSGASALPAAAAVGPEGRVVGVDVADALLELGRRKAHQRGLRNVTFRTGQMEDLGYPDAQFDAVVCVFTIFFAERMEQQVAELWRLVRPGGKLAITTWGPSMMEPGSGFLWQSVKRERPDLHVAFNPWDRITDPEAVRRLLREGGVPNAEIEAEDGRQPLRTPEDWWTIVLGSGYRWTVDQMGSEAAERVRAANVRFMGENAIAAVETNVIYAVATKDPA